MRLPLRWPLLPVDLIGFANVPAWFAFAYWGLNWQLSLLLLVSRAFFAGWFTPQKFWYTLLVMLLPTLFVGGGYHGRPWQWLAYGVVNPPLLCFSIQNLAPLIIGYWVVLKTGYMTNQFVQSLLQRS